MCDELRADKARAMSEATAAKEAGSALASQLRAAGLAAAAGRKESRQSAAEAAKSLRAALGRAEVGEAEASRLAGLLAAAEATALRAIAGEQSAMDALASAEVQQDFIFEEEKLSGLIILVALGKLAQVLLLCLSQERCAASSREAEVRATEAEAEAAAARDRLDKLVGEMNHWRRKAESLKKEVESLNKVAATAAVATADLRKQEQRNQEVGQKQSPSTQSMTKEPWLCLSPSWRRRTRSLEKKRRHTSKLSSTRSP